MAAIEEALGAVTDLRAAFDAETPGVHIFVYATPSRNRPNREDCWKRLSMSGDLSASFVDGLSSGINSIEGAVADGALSEFDYDNMANGQVGFLPLDSEEDMKKWLDDVPNLDWPNLFEIEDSEFLGKIRFIVSVLSFPDGRTLKSYRSKRGFDVVLTKPGLIAAFFSPGDRELTAVEGPVITIDQKVDFFEWDDFLYISNLPSFETVTNIRQVTRKKADYCISTLAQRFALPSIEELKGAIGLRTKLSKKLAAAAKHGLMDSIDGEAVIARIQKKGLSIGCTGTNGAYRFEFDVADKAQVEEFVELVTDAYLHSPTTGREWYALVKRPA